MNTERSCQVLLSLQRALLGEVTPNLRAVLVRYDDSTVHFVAIFDGPISEDDREGISSVETEVMADFPSSHRITHEVVRMDAPAQIPKDCAWAYLRKELFFE
jgi:hypothetical protein